MPNNSVLLVTASPDAYFFPWATSTRRHIVSPEQAFRIPARDLLWRYDKLIFLNGTECPALFDPAFRENPRRNSFYFLWDPVRCPRYVPPLPALQTLKHFHQVYSFQPADCTEFGLNFNSTMYVPPPLGLLPAPPAEKSIDVLFLGVPKDRLPLLREQFAGLSQTGLRVHFRIGLTAEDRNPPEEGPGWRITRDWLRYRDYLALLQQTRCLLDLYQSIQTGFSLRVMEHLFFEKKLLTNNQSIRNAPFYRPENIFLLTSQSKLQDIPAWLETPYSPIPEDLKRPYLIQSWTDRFS